MPKKVTTATKKVATKKVAKPKVTKVKLEAELVYAPDSKSFWVADGQILNSLKALERAFSDMEKEVFAHHVSAEKNDFADWVDKVLNDAACAVALRKAKTVKGAHTAVVRHLKLYKI